MVFKKSPNFQKGRGGQLPVMVVIHIIDGTQSSCDSWFANPVSKVSAHYSIGLNGEIHQYVDELDTAWANGRVQNPTSKIVLSKPGINPNSYSISIEHEGTDLNNWTDAQLQISIDHIKDICKRWEIPFDADHVVLHKEIFSGKPFCPSQSPNIKNRLLISDREQIKR